MYFKDTLNWELGQYIQIAISNCFSKSGNKYPQKPMFSKNPLENYDNRELTEQEKQVETQKFIDLFSNLGNYVKIKGGNNAKHK